NGCPLDSDGDGVPDYLDKCPNTPKGVKVDSNGCPLDSDGDGVPDYLDKCPGTPKGAKVDSRGCWVIPGAFFDTDKSDIKPQFELELAEALAILKKNPKLRIEVQGHTDSRGSDAYNETLSENRARAAVEFFVRMGLSRARFSVIGHGESRPIASNDTPEGRARNRRVELHPIR
ncbi:MAG: OmpA family protein, partial [Nitrospinota bacterium]